MQTVSPHNFHIPVMGIAFTLDTPFKVAHFGITSAISIIEDNIIETMRNHYHQESKQPYIPITTKENNYRSRRIKDYLNLMNQQVQDKVAHLKNSAFEAGSDLVKYFEMLPERHVLRTKFLHFIQATDPVEKDHLEHVLREEIVPGAIEVNIMTKVDKNNFDTTGTPIEDGSDALEALKGYAQSNLNNSAVIFSAGMNPRLYNYLENFKEFDAIDWNTFNKKIIIKVSDYRSALIQGKYLAKKGIWVSEFRIESGLNCGGHAFATPGLLLGPILEEFKTKKEELIESLFSLYNPAIQSKGQDGFKKPHSINITVQGGIGTAAEADFFLNQYNVKSNGWGTPFLLCPEATTVDKETLELLSKAKEHDVVLSKNSPLGVPFNFLKGTTSEKEKLQRIKRDIPGSPCTEKFLVSNTEFTKEPICTASRKYQKLKLDQLKSAGLPEDEYRKEVDEVLAKECLCIGLSNAAAINYKKTFLKKLTAVTICPGPNISNFSKIASLKEMTDHIYGRKSLLSNPKRPHMFIRELELYMEYFKKQVNELRNPDKRALRIQTSFCNSLLEGINYYRTLLVSFEFNTQFEDSLHYAERELKKIANSLLAYAK